ncbi:MAG: tetratricopeptide repeat protein [Deltaproteobacteria bacterium]|nr:tetratricopeptide repeat protein [Deltaproteobacteria bacterium]
MTKNSGTDNNEQVVVDEDADQIDSSTEDAKAAEIKSLEVDRSISPELEEAIDAALEAESTGADAGIKAWQSAWDIDPGHPEILENLERLYSESDKWTVFADFLKRMGRKIDDDAKFVEAHMTLARIYDEHINQDAMAVNTYQAIMKKRPDYLPAIDAAIVKYESMERWPDLVKMLKAKGDVVKDPDDAVELWLRIANLFMNQFSNQAEAIKAFEQVLEFDPIHPEAMDFLKEMYEKRRDWKKLLDIMSAQADAMDDGIEKIDALVEIARMAAERLKKPDICITHWEAVLEHDPENEEALADLANFYERAKEWEKLTSVLETSVLNTPDPDVQKDIYQKLGIIYGDKMSDDEKAVDAWKSLLEIVPDDRRAQEQLKKRYLALQAWDELEAFYGESGKWDEFIRVLEREASRDDLETSQKVGLYFKISELWRDQKERVDKSAEALEEVLKIDSSNIDAAKELIPIYEESGKEPARLAAALEVKLGHLEDLDEKLLLQQRISRLIEDEVGDSKRAFEGFLSAFKMNSTDETVQEDLERSAGKAGCWEDVVTVYNEAYETTEGEDKVTLRIKMARVMNEELGQTDEALKHFDEILADDPKNAKAVYALERIYAQMGRFEELMDIYAKRIDMAEDDDERKDIYYNQALLLEEEIDDIPKAINVYNKIIEIAGDEHRVLQALERIYIKLEKWADAASIVDRELLLGVEDASEEIDLKYRLGQICSQHLNDFEKAIDNYREVVVLNQEHSEAITALESLLDNEQVQRDASEILAPIYENTEKWEELVNVLDILAATSDDSIEQYDILIKMANVFINNLDSQERAFSAFSRAFLVNPDMPEALEQLDNISAILDCWKDFAELIEKGAASTDDTENGKRLWLKAAQIQDTQLDNSSGAISDYQSALKIDAQSSDAISALEDIFSREEKWQDLVDLLRIKVEAVSDSDEKQEILRHIARIAEDMLEQPEVAIACMKEILDIDSGSLDALSTLDKLYLSLEKWSDLADNLQQQLGIEVDVEKIIELKIRLADLQEKKLDELSASIDIYKEVLELDSTNENAVEALERIILNPEFKNDVSEILEPIYREQNSWEKLIGVLEIMISEEETVSRRVDLYHEIATLYETAGDEPEKAFSTLGKALREDPEQERTQEELERMATVLSLYAELAGMYCELVDGIEDDELKAAYHLKIAIIFEEQLQNIEKSVEHYKAVLAIEPMHIDAATALERAYQINENYEDLAAIYLKKVEMIDDIFEQKELLFKASQIYEDVLENIDKSIAVYKQILEIDSDELRAITQLEGLYLRLERWNDLQEIYNQKVELVQTPDEKKETLYVLGAMYERELDDSAKAITTYQRILEFDPDDIQAISRLDILFAEAEQWPDLLSILEREIELVEDPDEAVSFKYRVAELYVKHLDDIQRAIDYLNEILTVSPDHELTIKLLEQLVEGENEPLLAADVLEPLYTELAQWRKLVGVLEIKFKNSEDEWTQIQLLHQAAELLESDLHLDSPAEAFDMYARALKIDNANEKSLLQLEALAHATDKWSEFAKLLDELVENTEEDDIVVLLSLKAGAIYEENLDDFDSSIVRFQKVLSVDEENKDAIIRLDKLYQISEKWNELADVLSKESLIMEDPSDALDIQFRLGQLYRQELDNTERAVEVFRDILAAEPAHEQSISALEDIFAEGKMKAEIVDILEPLLQMQGEWNKLCSLYERQLDDMEDKEERIEKEHNIAETYEDKLLDPVEAFKWYCKAFSEDPFDERSGTDMERLSQSTEASSELADFYEKLFVDFEDKAAKKFIAKRLARIAEEELQDAARAEKAFRSCLEFGDDLEVLQSLDRIYTQYMEWERLVPILDKLAEVEPSVEDQVTNIFRMGDVLDTQLGDIEKARVAFHRITDDLDTGNFEALARLEIIYANLENWESLYKIYEQMKDIAPNEAEQADLYAKMATIASACLDDADKSIELWTGVIDILGEDAMALDALASLYSQKENWNELVEILERAVSVADEDDVRVKLYSQLGLVWGECLERDRNALENWQNVLSIDFENIPALQAIAKIYEANQEWEDLIETLDRIIEVGSSSFETDLLKSYYFKMATILSNVVERPLDSIEVWKKALDVDPADLKIVEPLEHLYKDQELWDDLVDLLSRKGDLLDGDDQIAVWMEQAGYMEEQLEQPHDAKEPYLKILSVSPLHDHAFEKSVFIMTELKEWQELIQLYSARLEYVQEKDVQISLLHKAAQVYEKNLHELDNAFLVMQRAFEIDYSNDETGDYLEKLATDTNKWQELFAVCNQLISAAENNKTQIDLCFRVGKWYAALGNPEYSIQYFQQVLALDSSNVPALRQMGELYRNAKQWVEFVEVLKRAVDCEDDKNVKKDILVDLGEVLREYLQDLPEARKMYKEALSIDPTLETAINALERLYKASENWEELIPVLRRKLDVLDVSDSDSIISTRQKIAEIYENNLNELSLATEEYKANLEILPEHSASLKGLERLYEKQEMWQDLLDILEVQLEYASSERERIELLSRIASMLEVEFRKSDKAIERLVEIIDIDPAHISTLESLESLYKKSGKWDDLIETYERHIGATPDRELRVPLYSSMANVLAAELKDPDRAMGAYQEILDIDADNVDALDNLAKLQVKVEDWVSANDTLLRLADTINDTEKRVELFYRLGELNEKQLMDRGTAVEQFRSALDIDPAHIGSLSALKKIHIDEGEWLAACDVLEKEQECMDNPRHKSKLQFELGELYRDKMSEEDTGIEWFEKSLESDPDNQNAAEPLVDVYIKAKKWEDAERLLSMLVRLGGKRSSEEMRPLQSKYGMVLDKVGNIEKAIKAYQTAYDIDTQYLPALLDYADALYRSEDWNAAFKLYQMVLVHHREEQSNSEIVDIFFRLGNIKANLKERRKALNMFDKALEIDSNHVPTLEAVIELQNEQKNFEQVIHFKKILIDSVESEDRQFELYNEIGDIWQNNLKNPQKAISAYQEAYNIKPDDRPIMHKLMPLYQATKQWQNVVDVITKICELEEDENKAARFYYAAGVIFRDEIKSAEDAVDYFNRSLDHSLENLKAFEAIDRILTQQKQWKELERNYRKMIHRISGKGKKEIEINLWHFLGEIYRSRMGQFEAAAEAFKMAAQLDPENITRHEILAELYTKIPGKLDEAVAEHRALIKQNPFKVDSYKALRRLYFEHRQYDKAWCMCSTLTYLKKADTEEQQFFEQYRPKGTVRAQARLDNELWIKNLFHENESVYIGKIFEMVTRAVRSLKIQPIKNFGLKKNQKRPPNDTLAFSKTFFYSAQVMNLPLIPELYLQEESPTGLNFAITDPMASACGSALLAGYSPQDLMFLVTKHLAYYRPEHYIRWILPTHGELKALMLACLKIGNPTMNIPDNEVVSQWQSVLLKNMNSMEVDNLTKVVHKFIKSGEQADLKKWITSLELTACRTGFLLSNDLETAARMIQSETVAVDDMSKKEKIKELVLFSVSEEYFRLREALGIVIGT